MADFLDNDAPKIFDYDGNELIEVIIPDGEDVPDDASTVWGTEVDEDQSVIDDNEENLIDSSPIIDISIFTFREHSDAVYSCAIHPSIPCLVVTGGGDDRGYLWRYAADIGQATSSTSVVSCMELAGHSDSVSSVGFNFDGTLLFTGSLDGTIRIWEVETTTLKHVLEGPEEVAFASWHQVVGIS